MKKISLPLCGILTFNGISILGNAITEIAIPWLILEISDSPALVAAVMAAKILPIILSTFFGAQIVDKFGGFRTSIISDLVNFLCVLMIPLFYSFDLMSFSLLAALLFFSTVFDTPGRLAKDVILMREIKANNHNNELINGLNTTVENICDLVGPVIAALIVASLGTVNALYFDAVTFLAVALGLVVLKKHFKANTDIVKPVATHSWQYFVEGLSYIKTQRQVLSVLLISTTVNLVITPFLVVYLPYVNKTVFDSVISFGLSVACFGAGTSLSSFIYGLYGKRFSSRQIILSGYILLIVVLSSIPLFQQQILFFAQLFLIGLCIGFAGPVEVTMIQRQIPEELFGRIMTLFTSMRFLCVPAGYFCFGWMLESDISAWTPIFMATIVFLGVCVYLWLCRSVINTKTRDTTIGNQS
ncbi:MAG: MFS transporter [Pseudomonadales bacterium]|nr:MFS transporter [Pseudomonadales bacterium]